MYGVDIKTLKVYSIGENGTNRIFQKEGPQGEEWKNESKTIFIEGSQKVRPWKSKTVSKVYKTN